MMKYKTFLFRVHVPAGTMPVWNPGWSLLYDCEHSAIYGWLHFYGSSLSPFPSSKNHVKKAVFHELRILSKRSIVALNMFQKLFELL